MTFQYNTNFLVKYFDIRNELMEKIQITGEVDYSKQDVENICEKLYQDELLSVFNAETIDDDSINICISQVFPHMKANKAFSNTLDHIVIQFCKLNITYAELIKRVNNNNKNNNDDTPSEYNINLFVFSTLFTYSLFHITHKCIVHILTKNSDDACLNNYLNLLENSAQAFFGS